ncbi:MAG: ThuA domain-containing protein, partial [Planctomycetales bacterium]|nr:ThuA domain-containing protein [Planctomycetales bacterium]
MTPHSIALTLAIFVILTLPRYGVAQTAKRPAAKVLLIGKEPDHPYGSHMYLHTSRVLAKCLENRDDVETVVSNGWPKNETQLDGVKTIVLYSSPGAEFLLDGPGAGELDELMHKGVGLVTIHWASSVYEMNLDRLGDRWGNYLGGFWVSNYGLSTDKSVLKQLDAEHPICRGWKEYDLHDEFYLKPVMRGAKPLLRVTTKGEDVIVGWAHERPGGGRAYGTTLGHYYRNFQIESFRKTIVNAILWTAHLDVPKNGADVTLDEQDLKLPPEPPKVPTNLRDDNLVAWCIVPFDGKKRGPAERAAMIKRLGLRRVAYDWRDEHVPTFEEEILQYKKHGIEYFAFWDVHEDAFKLFEKHKLRPQIWKMLGDPPGAAQEERVKAAAESLLPLVERTRRLGSKLGIYNHGGWSGEPENMISVCKYLREQHDAKHVGIVYNQHHGHQHVDGFANTLEKMGAYLFCLNLNGMTRGGEQNGQKILPIGSGELDVQLLKTIRDSKYDGPIGIIGHTQDDVEQRLQDNLDGLHWILPQLQGETPGAKPQLRTYKSTENRHSSTDLNAEQTKRIAQLIDAAGENGNAHRGLVAFASAKTACLSCHQIGEHGGTIGPPLTSIGKDRKHADIVESVLWPQHRVDPAYVAQMVIDDSGKTHRGYLVRQNDRELVLRDPAQPDSVLTFSQDNIDDHQEIGTLMPANVAGGMTDAELDHLLKFLFSLGTENQIASSVMSSLLEHAQAHVHGPAEFPLDRKPLQPEHWPNWNHQVNRNRIYDFYAKQADYFRKQSQV